MMPCAAEQHAVFYFAEGLGEIMDPLTHGLVGMVVGLNAGGTVSLSNGLMIASVVGSLIPDLDIVFQLRGDYAYLKQHRGISHSLPSAVVMSGLGAIILNLFYPEYNFFLLFPWVCFGFLSHLFLDSLNSYGAKIFWPISRRKQRFNLLPLFSPVIFLLCLFSMWRYTQGYHDFLISAIFVIYLLFRWILRNWAEQLIKVKLLKKKKALQVSVLPAGINLFRWDFIIEQRQKNIVGNVNLLKRSCKISQRLQCEKEEMRDFLAQTVLGRVFREFTPYFHISSEKKGDQLIYHFMDLRYQVKNGFLHNGTLRLNHKLEVEEAIFQPYHKSRRIYL